MQISTGRRPCGSFTYKSEEKWLSTKHIIAALKEAHEKAFGVSDEDDPVTVKPVRSLHNGCMVKAAIGRLSNDNRAALASALLDRLRP